MSQIWEYTKIAIKNIKGNKGRSILTMLGIIIGISSVIMVIAVGNGVKGQLNSELDNMGSGQIALYTDGKAGSIRFTADDFALIKEKVPNVKAVTPSMNGYGSAIGPKGDYYAMVKGGNEGLQYTSGEALVAGRYFTAEEVSQGKRVCVITENSAKKMFGTTEVLGLSFEVELNGISQEVSVVGIKKDTPAGLISGSVSDVTAEIPYTAMGNLFQYYTDSFTEFIVVADSAAQSTQVAQRSVNLMKNRYSVTEDNVILVQNFTDVASQITSIMDTITLFISFVAAISLLVGGIGVMNIMLVSVTERTREIGIRKALGARTGSILTQFLAEAGMITLLGGIIGIILGALGGFAICKALNYVPSISPATVVIASVFSSGVGIFFGIYPAKKAAALSPIEALRHE